jgi:hypothetical protein
MRSARRISVQKRRGRRAAGQGVQIGTRWPPDTVASIDAWIVQQQVPLRRSEAIRRLVELGLGTRTRSRQGSLARADRAKELASRTIDGLTAGAPDNTEKASRKGRLIKGPEEFQNTRLDRPQRK